MEEILDKRYQVVEKLATLFRFERMIHLATTCISLALLFGTIIYMIIQDKAGKPEFVLMFGSSGLITYAAARLLRMWDQALKIIVTGTLEEK